MDRVSQLQLFPAPAPVISHRAIADALEASRQKRLEAERALIDQWGGFWGARFLDGKAFFSPGTRVWAKDCSELMIARVNATEGRLEESRLLCFKLLHRDEIFFLHELTDAFLAQRKTRTLSPRVLFSDPPMPSYVESQKRKRSKKRPKTPEYTLTMQQLCQIVKKIVFSHFLGVPHQLIAIAQGYKNRGDISREASRHLLQAVEMELVSDGEVVDRDDVGDAFFDLLDKVAANPGMAYEISFTA
jgi:hypothetical protein